MTSKTFTRQSLIALANGASRSSDLEQWASDLRDSLARICPTVDRISTNVNRTANAVHGVGQVDPVTSVHVVDRSESRTSFHITTAPERDAAHFVDRFRSAGFPVDEYHEPVCFTYFIDGRVYVGSIILWNHAYSRPVDSHTIEHIESLRPFLTYLFVSAIARYTSVNHLFASTLAMISELTVDSKLSRREREVLICRFNGMSVAEVAEFLHISEATVRRHIRSLNGRLTKSTVTRGRVVGIRHSPTEEVDASPDPMT
ncbi:MAG TPA: LuxR C-terminal-related transcriptional regulator [Candidatus Kapabacteria bacterium]|nr:LuxR C-terminal-related transcriptional regulator [Candidatus Kapabacteria bacterium]